MKVRTFRRPDVHDEPGGQVVRALIDADDRTVWIESRKVGQGRWSCLTSMPRAEFERLERRAGRNRTLAEQLLDIVDKR